MLGKFFDLKTQFSTDGYQFGSANQPKTNANIYSLNAGDKYRITNAGITSNGDKVDIIYTVNYASGNGGNSLNFNDLNKKGIAFYNSKDLGKTPSSVASIAMFFVGYNNVSADVSYVKSGTNTKLNLTTATAWFDIDRGEAIYETQSNKQAIFKKNQPSFDPLNIDKGTVYATYKQLADGSFNDVNGYADADTKGGSYLGFGTGTNFELHVVNPYVQIGRAHV